MSVWTRVYRIGWLLLIVLAAIVAVSLYLPQYNRLRTMQRKIAELEQDNDRLQTRIRELLEYQRRFETDPAFVERMARERGWIKPEEMTFRLSRPPE